MAKLAPPEVPLGKTKIVATVGPASGSLERLTTLVQAGVDVFRLNFAHGAYDWFAEIVGWIRQISEDMEHPVGILCDLSGPKIRLGELPADGVRCRFGERVDFVRTAAEYRPLEFTCTYDQLIDDVRPGDRILLADGTVVLRVKEQDAAAGRVVCSVEQPGVVRSRQGVNLPGVALSTPSLTEKDRRDLMWALDHELDYVSLSFVRRVEDLRQMRQVIASHPTKTPPWIVAKIEKTEAIDDLEAIVAETDAVMVARGDLGVEADIAKVPVLQKRIIALCNRHRIPVITATQMLDSMQKNELPTRAEASDVANAVLDGTDAVMLSGETAVGDYPQETVRMMSRITTNAEQLLEPRPLGHDVHSSRTRATAITESVTRGAIAAAESLDADLIVVATRGGKTALALSGQRSRVPIIALTDRPEIARRMALFWGVLPVATAAVGYPPAELLDFVEQYGRAHNLIRPGSRLVLAGSSDWSLPWHDMMLVRVVT